MNERSGRASSAQNTVLLEWLVGCLDGRNSAAAVYEVLSDLIASARIRPGTRLPPVRELAAASGMSPSTISRAWVRLRRDRYVETRSGAGTIVSKWSGPRNETVMFAGWAQLELQHGHPDPRLIPSIDRALARGVHPDRPVLLGQTIIPALQRAVEAKWPFDAGCFTVMPTARAAIDAVLGLTISRGLIAVEDPTAARVMTFLERRELRTIAVSGDAEGPTVASFEAALDRGAELFIYQPHAGIPAGRTLSRDRRDQLAAVLSSRPVRPWILEEDPIGTLARSWGEGAALGAVFPERTVRIVQEWRGFGPDLEMAIIGGPASIISEIQARQSAGGVRVSPLLQEALAFQLTDPQTLLEVDHAAATYLERRLALARELAQLGVDDRSHGGIFAWIPVPSEATAEEHLTSFGMEVLRGRECSVDEPAQQHLRVALTRFPDDEVHIREFARAIALAVRSGPVLAATSTG